MVPLAFYLRELFHEGECGDPGLRLERMIGIVNAPEQERVLRLHPYKRVLQHSRVLLVEPSLLQEPVPHAALLPGGSLREASGLRGLLSLEGGRVLLEEGGVLAPGSRVVSGECGTRVAPVKVPGIGAICLDGRGRTVCGAKVRI